MEIDRVEIKKKAKEMMNGNIWNYWKPLLIIDAISFILSLIVTKVFGIASESTAGYFCDALIKAILMPMAIGNIYYILNLVRGESYELKDIFSKMDKIIPIYAITLITGLAVGFGVVLLIIPGIILGLSFAMINYLIADGETDIIETIKKSMSMMKGHKWELCKFYFSFFGWILLIIISFGIAAIWAAPYISFSEALYYEKLKSFNA